MEDYKRISLEDFDALFNRNELNSQCQRWALTHGFVQRDSDCNVIPYPMTIFPSAYPREEYHRAYRMQHGINQFIQRLAYDLSLMDSIFQNLIDSDPFIKRLREIFDRIEQIPFKSSIESCIIRTDYMLQEKNTSIERTKLRLVEINTIAVGLGAAAKLIHEWHKRILSRVRPELLPQLPDNESHKLIIDTLYKSWELYNNKTAMILFVIPAREFNIGDQMLIEQGLLSHEESSPLIKHVTFTDICQFCSLNSDGILYFNHFEVGLVYYRTAYSPEHFHSEEIWQAYFMLESSRAIKCPSLRYHLAGMKCFQLASMNKTFLENIFQQQKQYLQDFQEITEEMFTIDDPRLLQRIENDPESFYLKQSREGGGNVYRGLQLKDKLDEIIANKQSNRYFLMSRIYSPNHRNLVRPSRSNGLLIEEELNSELGMFGSLISDNGKLIYERTGGSLLRSKPVRNIEGGIASGRGFIDSILLV